MEIDVEIDIHHTRQTFSDLFCLTIRQFVARYNFWDS